MVPALGGGPQHVTYDAPATRPARPDRTRMSDTHACLNAVGE
jgi:hypothetical protein